MHTAVEARFKWGRHLALGRRVCIAVWALGFLAACGGPGPVKREPAYEPSDEPELVGNVHVERHGTEGKPKVLFVHGLGAAASKDWAPLYPALESELDIFAVDLPGFGESDRGNQLYSPDRMARAVMRAVEAQLEGAFMLVGHSLGGGVALEIAAQFPARVSKLLLIDVAGVLHRTVFTHSLLAGTAAGGAFFPQTIASLLSRHGPDPHALVSDPSLRESALSGDPNTISALALLDHRFGEVLDRVKAPTLILWGRDDTVAPLRTGQALSARLHAPLHVVDDVGHVPMKDATEWTASEVLRFASGEGLTTSDEQRGEQSGRDVRCDHQPGFMLEGSYRRVVLRGCQGAKLTNVRAQRLVMKDSEVEVTGGAIESTSGIGIDLDESRLKMTGTALHAPTCLRVNASQADLAGVVARCNKQFAVSRDTSKLSLSVVRTEVDGEVEHLHEVLALHDGQALP